MQYVTYSHTPEMLYGSDETETCGFWPLKECLQKWEGLGGAVVYRMPPLLQTSLPPH